MMSAIGGIDIVVNEEAKVLTMVLLRILEEGTAFCSRFIAEINFLCTGG